MDISCRFAVNSMLSVKVCSTWASTKWCVAIRTCSKRLNPNCHDENRNDGKFQYLLFEKHWAKWKLEILKFILEIIHCRSIRIYWHALKQECQCSRWHTPNTLKWICVVSYRARFVSIDYRSITFDFNFEFAFLLFRFRSLTKCCMFWKLFHPVIWPMRQLAQNRFFVRNHCVHMKYCRNYVTYRPWQSIISKKK